MIDSVVVSSDLQLYCVFDTQVKRGGELSTRPDGELDEMVGEGARQT